MHLVGPYILFGQYFENILLLLIKFDVTRSVSHMLHFPLSFINQYCLKNLHTMFTFKVYKHNLSNLIVRGRHHLFVGSAQRTDSLRRNESR